MRDRSLFLAAFSVAALAALLGAACKNASQPTPAVTASPESLYERYVEHYVDRNGSSDPIETWLYDGAGALEEYSQFSYDAGDRISQVSVYSSETKLDASTLVGKVLYSYDALGNRTKGTLETVSGGQLATTASYTATYNDQGCYTEFLETDGSGNVVEHRICTYDSTGLNYKTETYYSDAGTSDMIEQYQCFYDPSDPSKWIKELDYLNLAADYSRNMVYTYTWSGDEMYLESDFDESGAMVAAILDTFDSSGRQTARSDINQSGKLILYRAYDYDATGFLTGISYYNYNSSPGDELATREAYRLYVVGAKSMYEDDSYTYDYSSRGLGKSLGKAAEAGLKTPAAAHHGDKS
jgi:hypothetical protein